MTPEERDRARWAAVDDAEATLAALVAALENARLDDVLRYAADLEAVARILGDREPQSSGRDDR